jgi:hypothetical protein
MAPNTSASNTPLTTPIFRGTRIEELIRPRPIRRASRRAYFRIFHFVSVAAV